MKSAVETVNPTRVKLTVEVSYDELKPSLDAAYRTIASQVTVPGFRKGKVPPRIIDQRFGRDTVIQEAVNEALPRFYLQALEEREVRPLGGPQLDVTGLPDPAAGGDLTFTAEVEVRPEIALPPLDGVEVTVDDVDVSDEEVDAELQSLRERFGTLVPVDRAAATGDYVTLDLGATIDDEEVDTATGISYEVGSGEMLEGMDEVLVGLSAGETTTYTAPLSGGDRAGQDALVRLTVQSVKERNLPELDDDFAQLASEFDTLDELRESLSGRVAEVGRFRQGLQARERVLEKLLENVEIPVPEALIADEVRRHLESEGKDLDDPHAQEVDEQARESFREQVLLDKVVEAKQVSVAQQELVEYLVQMAMQYRMDPNEFVKQMDSAGQIPAVVGEVARRKALHAVLETAVITDASGDRIDVETLFPKPAEPEAGEGEGEGDAEAPGDGDSGDDELVTPRRPAVSTAPSADDPTALPTF